MENKDSPCSFYTAVKVCNQIAKIISKMQARQVKSDADKTVTPLVSHRSVRRMDRTLSRSSSSVEQPVVAPPSVQNNPALPQITRETDSRQSSCICTRVSLCHSHSQSVGTLHLRSLSRRSGTGWRPPLLTCWSLLVLLTTLPASMSSPVERSGSSSSSHSNSGSMRHARHSKWVNPCKFSSVPAAPKGVTVAESIQMYSNIIDTTNKAILQAKGFMPRYYEEIFGEPFNPGHLRDYHEEWLLSFMTRVGKYLGEDVDPEALIGLDVKDHLRAMYEGLQKFSVGLEQLVLDQAVYSGSFQLEFHEAEFKLKYVLCEVQIALWELQVPYTDQTRDLMEQKHRDIDSATQRNIRDWVIFKDYVSTLEYIKQTFTYLHDQAEKELRAERS